MYSVGSIVISDHFELCSLLLSIGSVVLFFCQHAHRRELYRPHFSWTVQKDSEWGLYPRSDHPNQYINHHKGKGRWLQWPQTMPEKSPRSRTAIRHPRCKGQVQACTVPLGYITHALIYSPKIWWRMTHPFKCAFVFVGCIVCELFDCHAVHSRHVSWLIHSVFVVTDWKT